MKQEIAKTIVGLFNQINLDQKAIVNQWTEREKKHKNIAIFLGDSKVSDQAGQELAVMLKKAIDAKDFSALEGKPAAPEKPATEAKPKTILDAGIESGKVEVVHIGEPKAEPKVEKPKTPERREHTPAETSGNATWALEQALAEFVRVHAPASTGSAPAQPAPSSPSVSEEDIRRICDQQIQAYFKRITG